MGGDHCIATFFSIITISSKAHIDWCIINWYTAEGEEYFCPQIQAKTGLSLRTRSRWRHCCNRQCIYKRRMSLHADLLERVAGTISTLSDLMLWVNYFNWFSEPMEGGLIPILIIATNLKMFKFIVDVLLCTIQMYRAILNTLMHTFNW